MAEVDDIFANLQPDMDHGGLDTVLDDVLQHSVEVYNSPSAILDELPARISDEKLAAFMDLVVHIDTVTMDYVDDPYDQVRPFQFFPDFSRAVEMPDGRFMVPYADKHGLQKYLQNQQVLGAIDTYYACYLQGDEEIVEGSEEAPDQAEEIQPQIGEMVESFNLLDTNVLFAIAGAYYWSENGPDRFVSIGDTLGEIARDAPIQMLIPLILTIEEYFPFKVGDDHYQPVVRSNRSKGFVAKDGVVFEIYHPDDLRWQLESACEIDSLYSTGYRGFDGDSFEDDFYFALAHLSRDVDEGGSPSSVERFMDEENHRGDLRFDKLHEGRD